MGEVTGMNDDSLVADVEREVAPVDELWTELVTGLGADNVSAHESGPIVFFKDDFEKSIRAELPPARSPRGAQSLRRR